MVTSASVARIRIARSVAHEVFYSARMAGRAEYRGLNYGEENSMNKLEEERRRLGSMSLEELTDWTASSAPNSENDQVARAEFFRRQTSALEETAQFTRRGAIGAIVSAAVLALIAFAAAVFFVFRRRRPRGQNRSRLQGPGRE